MYLETLEPVERVLQEGMRDREFYAFVISKMNRRLDQNLPVAGAVGLDHADLEWVLLINPDKINERAREIYKGTSEYSAKTYKAKELDEDSVPFEIKNTLLYSIMVHEFLHLTLNHIKRGLLYKDEYTQDGLNIAADFAINSMLRHGPHGKGLKLYGGLFPADHQLPDDRSMDQYLELLRKEAEKNGEGDGVPVTISQEAGQNGLGGDLSEAVDSVGPDGLPGKDGEGSDMSSSEKEEVASSKLKQRVRQTIRKLQKSGTQLRGIGSGEYEFLLDWVAKQQKINWENMLKVSLQGAPSFETDPTYSKPSRRSTSTIIFKGRRRLRKERVMVLVDTSGSMGESDYERVFGVLDSLAKVGTEVNIALWDYGHLAKEPVPLAQFKDKQAVLRGGGGTDMQAGVDYLCDNYETLFDKVLVVTDGYTPYHTKQNPPKKDVVWLVTDEGANLDNCAGTLIRLD